jgi:hypothetical protein
MAKTKTRASVKQRGDGSPKAPPKPWRLKLDGVNDYVELADHAGNRPTGDVWLYGRVQCDDYNLAPGESLNLGGRNLNGTIGEIFLQLDVIEGGFVFLELPFEGSFFGLGTPSTVSLLTVVGAGDEVELAAALDISAEQVTYLWRIPGGSWAQLGAVVSVTGVSNPMPAGTAAWRCGVSAGGGAGGASFCLRRVAMGHGLVVFEQTTLDLHFDDPGKHNSDHTAVRDVVSGLDATLEGGAELRTKPCSAA